MTRLRTSDIQDIAAGLPEYDRQLTSVTGLPLAALARKAAGLEEPGDLRRTTFCAVPISSGLGVIEGFSATVCGIIVHIGFSASVAPLKDEPGMAFVRKSGASVTLRADDDHFVAELRDGSLIDNTQATALAFVTGLDLMAGGCSGRAVLVLGCGPLGQAAAVALGALGARVTVFDPVERLAESLASRPGISMAVSFEKAVSGHDLIFDAAGSAGMIDARHVTSRTRIAAPGMPCGITCAAKRLLPRRFLHDPLQLGVAAMAFLAHKRHMTAEVH